MRTWIQSSREIRGRNWKKNCVSDLWKVCLPVDGDDDDEDDDEDESVELPGYGVSRRIFEYKATFCCGNYDRGRQR